MTWNVSGNEFLSQSSLLKTGVLKLGMTDFFHLVELILRGRTQDQKRRKERTNQCARELCT